MAKSFQKKKLDNAFDNEIKVILKKIKKDDVPSNFTTFYENHTNNKLKKEHIDYYNQLLEKENLSLEDKALICHSFFEYFKNQKNYEVAGSYLVKGNNAQYACKTFDLEMEKNFFMHWEPSKL